MIDFRRMRYLNNRLPVARLRLLEARSRATRITPVLTGMPHGTNTDSQVERGFMLIEAAKDALDRITDELQEMRCQLSGKLGGLTPLEETAITMRYMEGRSVREIAYTLVYSEQHIFRVISMAERKINQNES